MGQERTDEFHKAAVCRSYFDKLDRGFSVNILEHGSVAALDHCATK